MPDTQIPEINKNYKPTDEEQDIRKWVYQRYRQMKQSDERQRAEQIWTKSEQMWDQWRREKDQWDWQADYFVPLTTSVVESIMSEMGENLPEPLIVPRSSEDASKAKVMQAIFEYTWDQANGDDEMLKIMRGCLIHGTAIAQEYYLKDRRTVKKVVGLAPDEENEGRQKFDGEEEEVLEFDGAMMEWVSPWDFFVDEKARDVNRTQYKARDCVRRYVMNYRDAKSYFDGSHWDHLNNFQYVQPGGDTNYYQFYKPPQGIDHSEEVEVLWYWSRIPEDLLVIVINDVVVRMGPNPYNHKQLPFGRVIDVERLDQFYGKGEPELLESIQEEVNRMRRMVMDRHHLDIDKSFLIGQQTMLDEEDLIARPHGLIPVDDPQNVKPLEYGDIPLSVERTFRAINEDKIAVTGIDDRFQSVQKTPSTATEAAILKESTLKRIRMKLMQYEDRFLVDVGRMRIENILQFYTQPRLERIVGDKESTQYRREVARLSSQGMLQVTDGEIKKKSYPEVKTVGKRLVFDEMGRVQERKEPGYHFFEAKPELFVPNRGYDIIFEAGPALPVSKPLMQEKKQAMYDRLIELAMSGVTNYDPEKVADILVEAHDYNPEDLKREEAVKEENIEEKRLAMMIDLASQENAMVLDGQKIPEFGTPYAPPAHTEVHIQFLKSPQMVGAPKETYDKLLVHTVGEVRANQQRGRGQQGPGQRAMPQQPQAGGGAQMPAQGANNTGPVELPVRIQGGNQVPTGRALGNG